MVIEFFYVIHGLTAFLQYFVSISYNTLIIIIHLESFIFHEHYQMYLKAKILPIWIYSLAEMYGILLIHYRTKFLIKRHLLGCNVTANRMLDNLTSKSEE